MAISSSYEVWTAAADIFSGRTNPEWAVDQRVADKLKDLWTRMKVYSGEPPIPPVLGYRRVNLKGTFIASLAQLWLQ